MKPHRVSAAQGSQVGWALTVLQLLPLLSACFSQLQKGLKSLLREQGGEVWYSHTTVTLTVAEVLNWGRSENLLQPGVTFSHVPRCTRREGACGLAEAVPSTSLLTNARPEGSRHPSAGLPLSSSGQPGLLFRQAGCFKVLP